MLFRSVQNSFQSLQDNFCHSHFVLSGIIADTLIHRIFHPDTQYFLFYIFRLWSSCLRHICSYSCLYYHFITPSFFTIHSVYGRPLSQVYSSFRISPISSFMQTDFFLISSGAYASPWFRHT